MPCEQGADPMDKDGYYHMSDEFRDIGTGLFNEAYSLSTLGHEIERAKRYGDYFTLALIGFDGFIQCTRGSVPTWIMKHRDRWPISSPPASAGSILPPIWRTGCSPCI